MEKKKIYDSPLERILKCNYQDMTRIKLEIVKIITSLLTGFIFVRIFSWLDRSMYTEPWLFADPNNPKLILIMAVIWYFFFWRTILRGRGL
jgi:hypothetical protein